MSKRPPYDELMAACSILVLERLSAADFTAAGLFPDWFAAFAPAGFSPEGGRLRPATIFPFLEYFLEDAEEFWARGVDGKMVSGFWTETAPDGADMNFEAVAYRRGNSNFLFIRRLTTGFDRLHKVFQKGRELSLAHERLFSEISKKDILLHCIIHDMSGPLTGMMGALEIAKQENLSRRGKQLVDLGLAAAKRQANLINNLLDTFREEFGPADKTLPDPAQAPDAIACGREVLATLQPSLAMHDIRGEVRLPPGVASLRVIAEKSRLERIFYNLLQNAMRFSPRLGSIGVSFQAEEDFVRIAVEDEGPGVSPDVAPQIFQKFVRGNCSGGKAGLGLFFCRITTEQWGGSIGHEPRPGGGTSFWLRLKRVR
ncbi:MAG: HAMP domain-containing histidine kinase [Verrucomicrobia bacterium]|nr:HAMP domain-containing histidine kinase [Verrucomicrobiota bacterium]